MDKESKDLLKKIGSVIDKHEKKVGGYEKLKDVLCKELFSSCSLDNEQRLQRMAKHQGVSTGKVVVNAAKETYERTKKQYTKAEQGEIEIELNRTNVSKQNCFYRMGFDRGGSSARQGAKRYRVGVIVPLEFKLIIQEAAKKAGLSVTTFGRQAIYEKLGIQQEPEKQITQAERNDTTTIDEVQTIDMEGV